MPLIRRTTGTHAAPGRRGVLRRQTVLRADGRHRLPGVHRNRRFAVIGAVCGLTAAGGICLGVGVAAQQSPPQPPRAITQVDLARPRADPGPAGASGGSQRPLHRVVPNPSLPRSIPVSVDIPSIGVHSGLLRLGRAADGTIEVPPLQEKDSRAGWYEYSPTPGEIGPAVLLGHVDSAKYGPAVFFRLGAMRPGDVVSVHRADGSRARFRVEQIASYPKTAFPTEKVFGPTDQASLRLITCGGTFDSHTGSYESNIVAFATLIG